jgi:hypothetical protein
MIETHQIEARLFRALEKDPQTASANKAALARCLRVLRFWSIEYAVTGDLALRLREIGEKLGPIQIEIGIRSWGEIPLAKLEEAGFDVRLDRCTLAGAVVRFREVRPLALARAETFGQLRVLGAADVTRGMLDDACSGWAMAERRRELVAELEGLLAHFPDAFEDVDNAKRRLALAQEKVKAENHMKKEIPMQTKKPSGLDKVVTVAKAVLKLLPVVLLIASCDGGEAGPGLAYTDAGVACSIPSPTGDSLTPTGVARNTAHFVVIEDDVVAACNEMKAWRTVAFPGDTSFQGIDCSDPAHDFQGTTTQSWCVALIAQDKLAATYSSAGCTGLPSDGSTCLANAANSGAVGYTMDGSTCTSPFNSAGSSSTTTPSCVAASVVSMRAVSPARTPTMLVRSWAICSPAGKFLGWMCTQN